ncbi:MAG: DUF3341 domain-containing protein, partial [bacterium]
AVKALRAQGWAVHDCFTPYPVPGLDDAMELPHSQLGWVAFISAMVGAFSMLALELFVAVYAWPVNIGGRPNASIPAFIPPFFEAGVLNCALTTVLALMAVCQLYPGKEPRFELPRSTDDRFAVVLDADQAPGACDKIIAALKAGGALDVGEQMREAL